MDKVFVAVVVVPVISVAFEDKLGAIVLMKLLPLVVRVVTEEVVVTVVVSSSIIDLVVVIV